MRNIQTIKYKIKNIINKINFKLYFYKNNVKFNKNLNIINKYINVNK